LPAKYTKPNGSSRGKALFAPDPEKYLFNVDTLWYTVEIPNFDSVMDEGLRERLVRGRSTSDDSMELETIELKLDGYDNPIAFEILPGQRPMYQFSIRNEDYAFYFRSKDNVSNTNPVKVQINQFKLWTVGAEDAYVESLQFLVALGFVFGKAKPNRIDLCVHSDQFSWEYGDFRKFNYPRDPKRSNAPIFWHLDPDTDLFETVYFGSRETLQLRIYNKSLESKRKDKPYFLKLYEEKGMDPNNVWNVEFEVHRDYLKDFLNPDTFDEDFYDDMENLLSQKGLSYLWSWLVTKYSHDSPHWKVLQKGDINKFSLFSDELIRVKDVDSSKEREVAQLYGRLMKIVLDDETHEGIEFAEAVMKFVKMAGKFEADKGKNFTEGLVRKRSKYVDQRLNRLAYQREKHVLTGYVDEVARTEEQMRNALDFYRSEPIYRNWRDEPTEETRDIAKLIGNLESELLAVSIYREMNNDKMCYVHSSPIYEKKLGNKLVSLRAELERKKNDLKVLEIERNAEYDEVSKKYEENKKSSNKIKMPQPLTETVGHMR